MARKAKKAVSYTFPVVTWCDIEGRDVWVGDASSEFDCPILTKDANPELIAKLEEEYGQSVYVVRKVK